MDGDDVVRGAQRALAEAEADLEKFKASRVCVAAREAEDAAAVLTDQYGRALVTLKVKEERVREDRARCVAAIEGVARARAAAAPAAVAAPAALAAPAPAVAGASTSTPRLSDAKRKLLVSEHMPPSKFPATDAVFTKADGQPNKGLISTRARSEELAIPLVVAAKELAEMRPESLAALAASDPVLYARLEAAKATIVEGVDHAVIQSRDLVLVHRAGSWSVLEKVHGPDFGEGVTPTEVKRLEKCVQAVKDAAGKGSSSKSPAKKFTKPRYSRDQRDDWRHSDGYRGERGRPYDFSRDGRGGQGRGFGGGRGNR